MEKSCELLEKRIGFLSRYRVCIGLIADNLCRSYPHKKELIYFRVLLLFSCSQDTTLLESFSSPVSLISYQVIEAVRRSYPERLFSYYERIH